MGSVVALFGKRVIKNDKTIDRKMVSDVVFAHEVNAAETGCDHSSGCSPIYILNKIEQQREAGCTLVDSRGSASSGRKV